jgi:hypothetical protein
MADWKSKFTIRAFLRDTKPVWEFGLGGLLAVLLAAAASHLQWIRAHLQREVAIIAVLAVSYLLYLLRRFLRLACGFVEALIGVLVIIGTINRHPEKVDPSLLMVQIAAGMYVITRGFDNLALSSPFAGAASAFKAVWDLIKRKKHR